MTTKEVKNLIQSRFKTIIQARRAMGISEHKFALEMLECNRAFVARIEAYPSIELTEQEWQVVCAKLKAKYPSALLLKQAYKNRTGKSSTRPWEFLFNKPRFATQVWRTLATLANE